jgi:hypothetical protein
LSLAGVETRREKKKRKMVSSAGILSIDLKTGGILSLLDESDESLLVFALQQLNSVVDIFWAEIADSIDKM